MRCFLQGLRGLGIEVAKNLALAGPASITIYDSELVTLSDLGSNFYTTPSDVGVRTRADVSIEQLKELNPYVTITVQKVALSPQEIAEFDVVIVTDIWDRSYLQKVSNAVHAKQHGFIYGHVSGLFGSVFVDFGDVFKIYIN